MTLSAISTFTLWLLSAFVFIMIFLINFFVWAEVSIPIMIWFIVVFNLIMWLVSPTISDWMYRFFYKMDWITLDDIRAKYPVTARVIEKICQEHNIKIPKLWLIHDANPTAFTYGSGKWNARIIVSEWIGQFLSDDEQAAVYAHELWHIRNNDFIIMTIASTLLQILYEIYVSFTKASEKWGNSKGKWNLAIIWLISFVFYFIGQYIVLYLSRTREYYADQFSAENTDANKLSDALIKIAYGILATPNNTRLVESTKFIGIASDAMAKWIGTLYNNVNKDDTSEMIERSFLYDLYNPWAFLTEFISTHPLTGKRIARLMNLTSAPKYNIEMIKQKFPVDRTKLYWGFWKDVFTLVGIKLLPFVTAVVWFFIAPNSDSVVFTIVWWFIMGLWISLLIKTFWAYSNSNETQTTVLELMTDVYASPVKWKRVSLNGKIIWKWQPGYIFSEDVMFQDSTGIMYLDYQSKIPLVWNLFFSLTKVKKFIWQSVKTNGWFFRSVAHHTVVDELDSLDGTLSARGWVRFWGIVWGSILTVAPLVFMVLIFLS